MNTLVLSLIIANLIVNVGVTLFLGVNIKRLNKTNKDIKNMVEYQSQDICSAKGAILQRIDIIKNKILVSNAETRDSIKIALKETVEDEVPKKMFGYIFPYIWRR